MKTMFASFLQRCLRMCGVVALCGAAAGFAGAQRAVPRISFDVSNSEQTTLRGSQQPLALAQNDAGRMPGDSRLNGISMYFSRSAAQQADLDGLLAAQQDPASPQFHQWLTPDQFAVRFGMAQADLDAVQSWLERQGFTVDSVARSRNMIRFSGTVSQVETAFSTQMHYYQSGGVKHFAPSTALALPVSIAGVVSGVRNLNDFRPHPQIVKPRGAFTSSVSGSVFFAPGDIVTAYDVKPLYSAGVNGAGQTIVVVGQSSVKTSDIEAFQSASGLTVKDPSMVLVPGTGDPTPFANGDEGESDIDLEWSGALAPGANIDFVFTGGNTSFGVFDSIAYAVDEKLGDIISASYSSCETELNSTDVATLEAIMSQASAQGQSVIAASGDQGSTACSGDTRLTTAQQETVAVNYPASSAFVTGLGGTEIDQSNAIYETAGQGYWAAKGSSDVITSALKYIPEQAWNEDDSQFGLSATGGGTSSLIARPSWQTGVAGITSGSFRLVPDVALYSATGLPGFLYCTSDQSFWTTGQAASCNSGFRDSSTTDLTIAGGTSFATPIFAGMLALINQKAGYTTGQGLINSTLYKLAANSATYASAFHDISKGNNDCTAGSAFCNGTAGFAAGTGYDEVTGLGSVDVANLATAWPVNSGASAALIPSSTTVSASNTAPTAGQSVTFTITVAANSGSGIPTGTVSLSVDGGGTAYNNGGTTSSVTLAANGTATYTTSFTASGTHEIVASYAGGATYAASAGVATVTISTTSSGKGTFSLAATPASLTVAQGSQSNESITVTPAGGYTGTVNITYSTSNDTALANLCVFTGTGIDSTGAVAVPTSAAVTAQLTFDALASDCATTTGGAKKGLTRLQLKRSGPTANRGPAPAPQRNPIPVEAALGGLILAGVLRRASRKLRSLAMMIALAAVGMGMTACGSSSTTTVANPAKGTYTISLQGQDSVTTTSTASTTFTLVIN